MEATLPTKTSTTKSVKSKQSPKNTTGLDEIQLIESIANQNKLRLEKELACEYKEAEKLFELEMGSQN